MQHKLEKKTCLTSAKLAYSLVNQVQSRTGDWLDFTGKLLKEILMLLVKTYQPIWLRKVQTYTVEPG